MGIIGGVYCLTPRDRGRELCDRCGLHYASRKMATVFFGDHHINVCRYCARFAMHDHGFTGVVWSNRNQLKK
jgi:hypothetical protein